MLRVELEPGFVLHHRPFRDTSLLLEVLSQAHGRVGLVARGARGSRSRLRPLLQPFRPLLLSWQLRGELGTLSGAEPDGPALPLPAGEALLALYYVNELLLRLTARVDPHPGLFAAYREALDKLRAGGPPAPALRRFEKLLLDVLGYGPDLDFDHAGQPLVAERSYRYHPGGGLTPCAEDAEGALLGSSLLGLAAGELADGRALADARRLLRAALDVHLDGRPLKTRELLRQFRG